MASGTMTVSQSPSDLKLSFRPLMLADFTLDLRPCRRSFPSDGQSKTTSSRWSPCVTASPHGRACPHGDGPAAWTASGWRLTHSPDFRRAAAAISGMVPSALGPTFSIHVPPRAMVETRFRTMYPGDFHSLSYLEYPQPTWVTSIPSQRPSWFATGTSMSSKVW